MTKTLQQLKADRARLDKEIHEAEKGGQTAPPPTPAPLDAIGDRDSDFNLVTDTSEVIFQPSHPLMARPELREVDQRRQRIFFYKRLTDDKILTFTEAEAGRMMQSTHAPILRQLGVSDGTTYMNYLHTCGVKAGQRVSGVRAREILQAAWDAEMAAAMGHYADPMPNNVHFDASIRNHPNARGLIQGFVPN